MTWKPYAMGGLAVLAVIAAVNLAGRILTPPLTTEAAIEEGARVLRERMAAPAVTPPVRREAAPPVWTETLESLRIKAVSIPDCAAPEPLPKWPCPQAGEGTVITACHDAAYDYVMRSDGALRAGSRNPQTTGNTIYELCAPYKPGQSLMGLVVHPEVK